MRQEITLKNALDNQRSTNTEHTRVLRELQAENKESDRKLQRIIALGALAMPIFVVLLNYIAKKIQ